MVFMMANKALPVLAALISLTSLTTALSWLFTLATWPMCPQGAQHAPPQGLAVLSAQATLTPGNGMDSSSSQRSPSPWGLP